MPNVLVAFGRLLLGLVFIISGGAKLLVTDIASEQLSHLAVTRDMAVAVGIFEVVAGLLLAFGIGAMLAAILLIAAILIDALLNHNPLADPIQIGAALQSGAVIGGLLVVIGAKWQRRVDAYLRLDLADELVRERAADAARIGANRPWWRPLRWPRNRSEP